MSDELTNERIALLHTRMDTLQDLVVKLITICEKMQQEVKQLQDENWRLSKNITNIEKSLRAVCIDTENPIHF